MVTIRRSFDPHASINESNTNNVVIYPNPTQNYIVIELKSENSFTNYSLIDISGKQLISNAELMKKFTLDFTDFKPGIYFIQLKNSDGTSVSHKIVLN